MGMTKFERKSKPKIGLAKHINEFGRIQNMMRESGLSYKEDVMSVNPVMHSNNPAHLSRTRFGHCGGATKFYQNRSVKNDRYRRCGKTFATQGGGMFRDRRMMKKTQEKNPGKVSKYLSFTQYL